LGKASKKGVVAADGIHCLRIDDHRPPPVGGRQVTTHHALVMISPIMMPQNSDDLEQQVDIVKFGVTFQGRGYARDCAIAGAIRH